jgi:hypothetical protein
MRKKTFYTFCPKEGDRRLRQFHQDFAKAHPNLTEEGIPLFLPLWAEQTERSAPPSPLIFTRIFHKFGGVYLGAEPHSPWKTLLPGLILGFGPWPEEELDLEEPLVFRKGYIDRLEVLYEPPLGQGFLRWKVLQRTPWKNPS